MLNTIKMILISTALFLVVGCGFHFQHGELIPSQLKRLHLESQDTYSPIVTAMRKQLQENGVKLVEDSQTVPVLRINKTITNDQVASIFKSGREAEKILIIEVEATLKLSDQKVYPIKAAVNRTFFDNSRAALAKSTEKEVIWHDMYEQAARQLITKMISFNRELVK